MIYHPGQIKQHYVVARWNPFLQDAECWQSSVGLWQTLAWLSNFKSYESFMLFGWQNIPVLYKDTWAEPYEGMEE